MSYKISLTGDLGGGKSTVAKLFVSQYPEFEIYSTGTLMREMAQNAGMTIEEFNRASEENGTADTVIDNGLKALSSDERNLIIDSRMAWHFVSDTFKVYLSCDEEVSAARVMADKRANEVFSDIEDAVASLAKRRASERKRYSDFYGVDITDLKNYNLILDTSSASVETVAQYLADSFEKWKENHGIRLCYISPERLMYDPEGIDMDYASRLCDTLSDERDIDEVTVISQGRNFYIENGNNAALAYSLCDYEYVPVRIVDKPLDKKTEYVKMKTSL